MMVGTAPWKTEPIHDNDNDNDNEKIFIAK